VPTDGLHVSLIISTIVFSALLALTSVFWPTVAFWIAYVLTRPLGGSTGAYLSGAPDEGGARVSGRS
jgi:uncharacterized membrane-anchored protein